MFVTFFTVCTIAGAFHFSSAANTNILPAKINKTKSLKNSALSKDFKNQVYRLALDYQFQKSKMTTTKNSQPNFLKSLDSVYNYTHDYCEPRYEDCLNAVCSRMSDFNCDSTSEVSEILEACRGTDGSCVRESCERMSSFECDDLSETTAIARSCKYVGYGCTAAVCSSMSSFRCDETEEIVAVNEMCQDTSGECIRAVCSRLTSYSCDSISELREIAQQCSGR